MDIKIDDEFKEKINRLYVIAKSHSDNECDKEIISEANDILINIKRYAHKISKERKVQIEQIQNNTSNIMQILNQPAKENHLPFVTNCIDNLGRYCDIQM